MTEMTPLEAAVGTLVHTFNKYALSEGKKDTLTKEELKNLLKGELPGIIGGPKDKGALDDIMNKLDTDSSSDLDFKEFIIFVAEIACVVHNICTKKTKK
ncbi:protein S100-P-like [Latimeria chalumnae]|nr:PREDICTED: protein S100-P-like [Latimeria chalumnae]|eukprot:XP_006013832.1 PREDICTED: protein S100-P-like [Latimeria chalumnae]